MGSESGSNYGFVAGVLVGAAVAGVGLGVFLGRGETVAPVAAIDPAVHQKVETIVPQVTADPADSGWSKLAETTQGASARFGTSPVSGGAGIRASFNYCKWGGGTNCVVDGDTFWIGGQKVRIADIDAPETHDYRCASELALGERAARKLQALLNSGAVTMTHIDRDRDVYGRLLRNVAVNGADVGETLVAAGVTRDYAGGRRSWCG